MRESVVFMIFSVKLIISRYWILFESLEDIFLLTLQNQGCNKEGFPYSVQMRENADQNNSEYGYFSRSANHRKKQWYLEKIRITFDCQITNCNYQ